MTTEEAGHYSPSAWRCSNGCHPWSETVVTYDGSKAEHVCPNDAAEYMAAAMLRASLAR